MVVFTFGSGVDEKYKFTFILGVTPSTSSLLESPLLTESIHTNQLHRKRTKSCYCYAQRLRLKEVET